MIILIMVDSANLFQVISHIENSLYGIYCKSVVLSTHLLESEDLLTLDQLSKDLGKIVNECRSDPSVFLDDLYYAITIFLSHNILLLNSFFFFF